MRIEGVVYQFIVKGRRSKDNWDGLYKQGSHLIYGWVKLDTLKDEFPEWAWTFSWPKEDGQGESRLGKGWQKKPIWSDYPGGVKAWIEALHSRTVFPRHLDPFESIFPQSLPVERRRDEVEHWRQQVTAQEMRIVKSLELTNWAEGSEVFASTLDNEFPQHTGACHQFNSCQFIDICFNNVPAEPGELYTIRLANHPESGEEEE